MARASFKLKKSVESRVGSTRTLIVPGCRVLALTVLCCLSALGGAAQDQDVLCRAGNGSFQAKLESTGVTVQVRASRNGELATRGCDAVLSWSNKNLTVATNAAQVDVDEFGGDVGLGGPVVAFQVKKNEADCCREYQVYSLTEPPRLLQKITGGESFSAADTDLDGRVEIWTDDAAATNGIEGLTLGELVPPPIILRFSRGKLLDVSGEFVSYSDADIAKLRTQLNKDDLQNFKDSSGKLLPENRLSTERWHELRRVKARVLGIVLGYLYSRREQQAWDALAEMWPASDIGRVREELLTARARGISARTAGVSAGRSSLRKKHTPVFDATGGSFRGRPEVVPPRAILLTRPALIGRTDLSESTLELVIDSAGKVRSVEPAGKDTVDPTLMDAASEWKFIPALKDGRAVASRMRLSVSLKQ